MKLGSDKGAPGIPRYGFDVSPVSFETVGVPCTRPALTFISRPVIGGQILKIGIEVQTPTPPNPYKKGLGNSSESEAGMDHRFGPILYSIPK